MLDEATPPHYGYEEFNPTTTAIGCAACGYPVRPTDTECPVCGHAFSGYNKGSNTDKTATKKPAGATVIQGVFSEKDFGNK
jgi:hypothetical protein